MGWSPLWKSIRVMKIDVFVLLMIDLLLHNPEKQKGFPDF